MQRRLFVLGTFGCALGTSLALKCRMPSRSTDGLAIHGQRMEDGRFLVRKAATAFGTTIALAAVHEDPVLAHQALREAINETQTIDALMSLFRSDSQISILNQTGRLSRPHTHVVNNLRFAQELSMLTHGAFDITVQPLWELFFRAKKLGRLPSDDEIAHERSRVHWNSVQCDDEQVRLLDANTRITLNSIAQGYATDVAAHILKRHGIVDALIDTGEFLGSGSRQPHHPWLLGIQHPRKPDELAASLALDGRFISTSGDYATTFSEDYLYHHIFDPATGTSPTHYSSTVVLASSGLWSDGLSTALMVLDRPVARALLTHYPGSDALWIDKATAMQATTGIPFATDESV